MSQTWRFVLFFSTLTLVLGALCVHVQRRITRAFALPKWMRQTFVAILVSGLLAGFLGRLVSQHAPAVARMLGAFGGAVTLGVLITSVLLWPYELATLIKRLARRGGTRDDGPPPEPERRAFLTQAAVGGAASLGMGSAVYGTLFGRTDYALETVPIKLEKLPRALEGFSMAQLSDIHVGLFVGEPELERALMLLRDAKPDIVVLTGDLIDSDIAYAPLLGRFVRQVREIVPRGVFAIPGNHDHYAGASAVMNVLREAGADVLLNRHVRIGDAQHQLVLAGVDDVAGPQFGSTGPRLERAFEGAPPDLARVLLSHNPSFFPEAQRQADLTLSGHTHGGQITLFINPAELVLRHGFVRGHYLRDRSQLYVNRGFGTAGPPARVGSPPEVTKIILTG